MARPAYASPPFRWLKVRLWEQDVGAPKNERLYGLPVSHSMLILSIASGQAVLLGFMEDTIMAFHGLTWKFAKPVFMGDSVHLRVTVAGKKVMKRLGGGNVTFKIEVLNQDGQTSRGSPSLRMIDLYSVRSVL